MRVWILWTRQACGGAGTAGATRVEVCPSERWAQLGGPHHGFRQACYSYEAHEDGTLTDERHEWDTDDRGWPAVIPSSALKLGPYQTAMLEGCLRWGRWSRDCGWKLHRNVRHTERLADRLVERGLLKRTMHEGAEVYTLANPELCKKIVANGGVIPREALAEVTT